MECTVHIDSSGIHDVLVDVGHSILADGEVDGAHITVYVCLVVEGDVLFRSNHCVAVSVLVAIC